MQGGDEKAKECVFMQNFTVSLDEKTQKVMFSCFGPVDDGRYWEMHYKEYTIGGRSLL